MTRKELIEQLEQVKDKIADSDELTEYARYRADISVEWDLSDAVCIKIYL